MNRIIRSLIAICLSLSFAKAAEQRLHSTEGNFIVPYYEQPRPLIGFGQNILKNAGTWIVSTRALDWNNTKGYAVEQTNVLLYAPTTECSFLCAMPVADRLKRGQRRSAGLQDMLFQGEYALFYESHPARTQQATVVASLTAPTGDPGKRPPTGYGVPTVFLGGTYNYTHVDWYFFVSSGELIAGPHNHVKSGNVFLYQGGVGRHLFTIDRNWYFALMEELDGYYAQRNAVDGVIDPESGRDILYLTSSLYIASHKSGLLIKFGMGFPVYQQLHAKTARERYVVGGQIAIGF